MIRGIIKLIGSIFIIASVIILGYADISVLKQKASTLPIKVEHVISSIPSSIGSSTSSTNTGTSTVGQTTSQSISDETSNWAGYTATNGIYTSVSGSWTVPSVSSDDDGTSADATWIGIGGVSSDDLIQTGTENIVTDDGQISTQAFYELLPDNSISIPSLSVSSGDSLSASIKEISSDVFSITITDNTTGQSYNTSVDYDSSLSSADWIEEDPSDGVSQIPLDDFGTVTFTGVSTTENGNQLNLDSSNAQALTMINDQQQDLATTSSTSSDGSSFSVNRTSASSGDSIAEFNSDPDIWHRHGIGINISGRGFGFTIE